MKRAVLSIACAAALLLAGVSALAQSAGFSAANAPQQVRFTMQAVQPLQRRLHMPLPVACIQAVIVCDRAAPGSGQRGPFDSSWIIA